MALPDADMLVLDVIRTAEPTLNCGTQIYDKLIEDVTAGEPFAMVRRFGGAAVDPRFYDRATFDIQVWASTRKAAFDTSSAIREALLDAALNQTTFDEGHIARMVEVAGPSELRTADQADGVWRFQATYSLFLRPAPA